MAKFATFKLVSRDFCDYQCLLWFEVHWADEFSNAARQRPMLLAKEEMANFVHDFDLVKVFDFGPQSLGRLYYFTS